jgi:hypothetical protein
MLIKYIINLHLYYALLGAALNFSTLMRQCETMNPGMFLIIRNIVHLHLQAI